MNEKRKEVVDNLTAAGCNKKTIEKYCECCDCGDEKGKEKLLQKHRRELLDDMHKCQKKIDCLDYLRYQEKEKKKEKE